MPTDPHNFNDYNSAQRKVEEREGGDRREAFPVAMPTFKMLLSLITPDILRLEKFASFTKFCHFPNHYHSSMHGRPLVTAANSKSIPMASCICAQEKVIAPSTKKS